MLIALAAIAAGGVPIAAASPARRAALRRAPPLLGFDDRAPDRVARAAQREAAAR